MIALVSRNSSRPNSPHSRPLPSLPVTSVVVTVVDVGEVLVFMRDREMPMLGPGEDGDRVGSVVRIVQVDRVRVLDNFVRVAMAVVAGGDDQDSGERHGEGDEGRRGESVAIDGPGEDGTDEWGEGEEDLPACCPDQPGASDPHRDRQPVPDRSDRECRRHVPQCWETVEGDAEEEIHGAGDEALDEGDL